jgi:hypothetical protein
MKLSPRTVEVFKSDSELPQDLKDNKYYTPLLSNFAFADALTKDAAIQFSVTLFHPIKGVQAINRVAKLYPDESLRLVFVVPESLVKEFKAQDILTSSGNYPAKPPYVSQFVVGLPLGIDRETLGKKRRLG